MYSKAKKWYKKLEKPSWTPSPKLISIIWTLLYPLIFLSYGYVFVNTFSNYIEPEILGIFTVNLVCNFLFTPILFGLKNLKLAFVDIAIVWITIIMEIAFIYPYSPLVAALQLPYFAWVTVASALQTYITLKN